ncbi:MAG: thiamine pyrophosphate-binding protein [Candidatus Hydrogenedentota bacterium]
MSEKAETKTKSTEEPVNASRRTFMKSAAAGAGAVSAAMAAQHAEASTPDDYTNIAAPTEFFDGVEDHAETPFQFPARGADIFAKACKDEGLAALFCCPGNYSILSALANQGIPTYGGRQEGQMTSAADAFIRVTGEVAAASGTEGPGFTNMICAIAAAHACHTPLLVLASNMSLRGDDTQRGIQRGYQQPTTEGIKKYGKRIVSKERVHEYAGYAFRQLKSGVPGPVHLDFVSEAAGRASTIESPLDLDAYYDKTKYRTEAKAYPDPKDIDKAIDMIKKAKRPMIVASMGVFYSKAWDELRAFAEKTDIPVVESGPTRGHFSDGHRLSASTSPSAIYSVDLAILIGQYCMPTIGEYPFDIDCKYIRIDKSAEDIGRNLPIDLGIIADERAALDELAAKAPAMKHDSWVAEVAAARVEFEKENDAHYKTGLGYTDAVHPAVMSTELSKFLYRSDIPKEQTTVASGGFGIGRYMRRRLRAYRPGQISNGAYQYGSIGPDVGYTFGVGVAVKRGIGAQKAYQGGPVIGITGDAGFGYSGMEIDTLCKYKIPAIIIVYNNNAWGTWSGYSKMKRVAHVHLFQENLRYDLMAKALGGNGEYVTKPEDFTPALERAWKVAVDDSMPTVINCQAKKEFWSGGKDWAPGMLGKVEPGCMSYSH